MNQFRMRVVIDMKCEKCGQEIQNKARTSYTEIEFNAEYSIVVLRIDNCRVRIMGKYNHIEVNEAYKYEP